MRKWICEVQKVKYCTLKCFKVASTQAQLTKFPWSASSLQNYTGDCKHNTENISFFTFCAAKHTELNRREIIHNIEINGREQMGKNIGDRLKSISHSAYL